MRFLHLTTAVVGTLASVSHAFHNGLRARTPRDFERLAAVAEEAERAQEELERNTTSSYGYTTRWIDLPIDHFQNESMYEPHSSGTFPNRYWFTDRYYKPGGPVVLLLVGEASGTLRLPILHTGIAHQFIKENNGLGVVMEHRYYGKSFPTPDLSTENLRFLTTQQALADCAYLAQNVQFEGLEQYGDLTSNSVPWFTYGGSYSGAMSAFLRVQYPDVFYGSISSSGVTMAIYDYWQYWAPIAQYAPSACIAAQKLFTNMTDTIYYTGNSTLIAQLQSVFGLPNITHFNDFAYQLSDGISDWQSLIWDPAISYDGFYWYCGNISSTSVLFPSTESLRSEAEAVLEAGGQTASTTLTNQLLNFIGWNNETNIAGCTASGQTQDDCFGTHNPSKYQDTSLRNYNQLSWSYQVCTQWGFFQTGSGWPAGEQGLISRTIDLDYSSIICREAFGIHSPPDVSIPNQYGGYNIAYDRLAIINGEWDPWRPATPAAFPYGAARRKSTIDEPFHVIPRAVHHWDEYGVKEKLVTPTFPPKTIKRIQAKEHTFFKAWLEEWNSSYGNSTWSK